MKHYVSFLNPKGGRLERVWFATEAERLAFLADLRYDFPSISFRMWEELEQAAA